MPVPQQLINLLNLSVPTLQKLATGAGIDVGARWSKWELASELAGLPQGVLDQIVGEWLYAGQTSVTWVEMGDRQPLEVGGVRAALVAMYHWDPFEQDVRPDRVTSRPQLIDARIWTDTKVVFTFAVTKRVARVLHNFETEEVYVDEFFVAVLRLDHGVLEIRASHSRARLLVNTWLAEFAEHMEEPVAA